MFTTFFYYICQGAEIELFLKKSKKSCRFVCIYVYYTQVKELKNRRNKMKQTYKPTEKQKNLWEQFETAELLTDEEIKLQWKKSHRGSVRGWGMLKKQMATQLLQCTYDYQLGLWQGKLDRCNDLEYSEQRLSKNYNLGYYRGYDENIHGYLDDAKRVNPNFAHLNEAIA